jgi:hypothetical protein
MAKNIDELYEEIVADELTDAKLLPPIQYARLRGIYPQKVYSAIRNHRLDPTICQCGRKVIEVEAADAYFRLGQFTPGADETLSTEEEVSGSDLDSGHEVS